MYKKLFISYSHADIDLVKKFAYQLSLAGFDLWIDEKNISSGDYYTTAILNAIHEADMYLVFITDSSIHSKWVTAEIDFALKEKIERKKLTIVPVLLDNSEVPVSISNLDFIDARFSILAATNDFINKFGKKDHMNGSDNKFNICSVGFEIKDTTDIEVQSYYSDFTITDLTESRELLLKDLRKCAHGILMNFVSIDDFDFQSELPKYKNGIYEECIQRTHGSADGSVAEQVKVEAVVFNPDEQKLNRLLNERLSILKINAITFGFTVGVFDDETLLDVGKRCLQRLQDDYIILSYDNIEGAKVEINQDFYLSFMPSESVLKVKLSASYDCQFEGKMKNFSLMDFLENLLGHRYFS